ncbi:MAG: PHP domain-containing protein [Ruminococcaceae bacterium]|nr:PHP domain-containing protein [Oscillospiraceae bacterium]
MHTNLHTHTFRCHHAAKASEREYIENAISSGIKTLGFSEHIPCPFHDGHESGYRLFKADIDDYFTTLHKYKEEYKNDIKILIGFESEYYPEYFAAMLDFAAPYKPEYLILGQHFTYNEEDGHYCAIATDSKDRLENYVNQCLEGLKTGKFTYLCHPDLMNFVGDDEYYYFQMKRLCAGVKELNIPLEFNFLGFTTNRPYPCKRFFKIAAEVGNDIILGCDAHSPEAMITKETEQKAIAFLSEFGVTPKESIDIKFLKW